MEADVQSTLSISKQTVWQSACKRLLQLLVRGSTIANDWSTQCLPIGLFKMSAGQRLGASSRRPEDMRRTRIGDTSHRSMWILSPNVERSATAASASVLASSGPHSAQELLKSFWSNSEVQNLKRFCSHLISLPIEQSSTAIWTASKQANLILRFCSVFSFCQNRCSIVHTLLAT